MGQFQKHQNYYTDHLSIQDLHTVHTYTTVRLTMPMRRKTSCNWNNLKTLNGRQKDSQTKFHIYHSIHTNYLLT